MSARSQLPHISGCHSLALGVADDKFILDGRIHRRDLQISESVPSGKLHHGRKHVDVNVFLLDPALGDPAAVVLGVFRQFFICFGKFQLQIGRRIRMTSGVGEFKRNVSDQMRAEIETKILPLSHRKMMHSMHFYFFSLRAVSVLQNKGADRLHDPVMQDRTKLFCSVKEFRVIERMKILNNTYECHEMSSLCSLLLNFRRVSPCDHVLQSSITWYDGEMPISHARCRYDERSSGRIRTDRLLCLHSFISLLLYYLIHADATFDANGLNVVAKCW